jgi:hypothetical protein
MSEDSNKPPSINLEELERQLREALSRRTAPTDAAHDGAGNEDPLSMLARLVEYEGAAKQANTQPVAQPTTPVYAAPDPALPDPAYQQPAGWQPYEEQIPVDPAAGYQTHDHLVFDPNRNAELPEQHADEPVVPPVVSGYAPYVPQPSASPLYQNQSAAEFEPVPAQPARPDTASYYGGVSAHHGAEEPVSQTAAPVAPRDYFAPSQPVAAAPSYEPVAYDPKAYDRHHPSTTTHDILALSPSEIRSASDADALNALYGNNRHTSVSATVPLSESAASSAYAPQSAEQRSAADRALVYAAAFPDKTQPNQWQGDTSQVVGLSYSEAEANLGAEQRPAEPPQKSQGKGLVILLGLVVVMAGGFGLAAYLRNEGARVPSGAPPVISADKTPVKVVPANPGGTEVPNQGAAIYQPSKPEDAKEAKVVSTDEKPVDISAAPRPPGSPLIGEPKKIRTVTVRPDGTLVEENTIAAGSPVPNAAATPRSAPSMVTIQPPVASTPASVPSVSAATANPPPAQVTTTAGAVRVMPPARPQGADPVSAPAAATPARSTPPAPAAPAPVETVERTPTGDYGVQFSAPGTEAEARNAIVALKRSYASILDGMTVTSQKAENNGRSFFRVRAVGLSREEAISVCEKIKATGGQCFVARN